MDKYLYVVYHSSDLFAPVLGTSLVSLYVNNSLMESITVYVIEDKISEENKALLKKLTKQFGRIIFFIPMEDVNRVQDLQLKKVSSSWQFFSFCRLFLDQILPDTVHKILYLDSDVLILDDLTELWNTDMSDYCAAGVIDYLGEKYYKSLGLSPDSFYCNSGVILQNLDLWKEMKIGDRVRDYVRSFNGYIYFVDQTAFNGALQGRIKILHPKYNVFTIEQVLSVEDIKLLRRIERGYAEEELKEAVENPVIVHLTRFFLVTNRPWYENTNHPMKEKYLEYKGLTPWKDQPAFMDTRTKKEKILQYAVDHLPRKIVLKAASFLYNEWRIWKLRKNLKKYTGR